MKYTNRMKANGELAMRNMSEWAAAFYETTDPLDVYEYEIDDETRYAYNLGGELVEGLTFEELEKEFEALAKETAPQFFLTDEEMEALKNAMPIGRQTDDEVRAEYSFGALTINTARNGRRVAWYLDDAYNCAIYIDTLEELTSDEIEKELA